MSGYDELIETALRGLRGKAMTTRGFFGREAPPPAFPESRCSKHALEDHFDGELNLARRGGGSGHDPGSSR